MTFAANTINVQSSRLPFATHHDGRFTGKHILSVAQFGLDDLAYIFDVAEEFRLIVRRIGIMDLLKGHVLATLFYEPSTRTSSSFIAAIHRLGGTVVPISEVRYSSVSKGESLPDTIRTLESYADVIVLRHPEKGSAALAAKYARKPIINAGDGVGEHPTQALLDQQGVAQYECADLHEVLPQTDVLYVTRIQQERFEDPREYEKLKDSYIITPELMTGAKRELCLMHPLPRVGEISMEVDDDPRAAYFRQMEYGLYVRMAILALVLGKA